ncbi:hypothetical protein ACFL1R_11510 [Candidatus Latescibacterota bacterium]
MRRYRVQSVKIRIVFNGAFIYSKLLGQEAASTKTNPSTSLSYKTDLDKSMLKSFCLPVKSCPINLGYVALHS